MGRCYKICLEQRIFQEYFAPCRQIYPPCYKWNDPVDSLPVHAYIARTYHKTMVEEKHKRNEVDEGPSKRITRVGKRK